MSTEKILKVLKSYTTDLPNATRFVSLDNRTTWINSCVMDGLRQVVMHVLRQVVMDVLRKVVMDVLRQVVMDVLRQVVMDVLRQVVMDDKNRTINDIPVNIYYMALTKSTDILLSIYVAVHMLNCRQSGEIKQFPSVAPLLPTGKKTKRTDIVLSILYGSSDVKLLTKSGEICPTYDILSPTILERQK